MGITSWSDSENKYSPNTNPILYNIINQEIIGDYNIVEAQYIGCTTFGGKKLMLLKTNKHIESFHNLDPHLLGNGHLVIARFEPTVEGKRLARICALYSMEVLKKDNNE